MLHSSTDFRNLADIHGRVGGKHTPSITPKNDSPKLMLAKYKIEYSVPFSRHAEHLHHLTNDPVACEEFLTELLEKKFRIRKVLHEGVELSRVDFDQMVKTAAGVLAANHICAALDIDSVEARHRFGSPA